MGSVIANLFANKELKDRILFTFMMFVIFRLGVHIPVPGVDASVIESLFTSGNLFGFLDLFSGGALSKFSIFAMSITPYINSSIIMQLLTAVIPTLEEWRKDGQEGFKKIQKVTRYFTIFLAAVQAFGMTYALRINNALVDNSWLYFVFVVVVLTAGTCLLMWIGEKITEHGIGNGISLIIFCGIVARFPQAITTVIDYLKVGTISPFQLLLFLVIALVMILMVIEVNEGQRRIPIQYAKRVIGRRMYGGHSTYLPLKVNQAGVIPIIFASSILMLPVTLAQFVHIGWVQAVGNFFGWGTWPNTICHKMGAKNVVVTGVSFEKDKLGAAVYDGHSVEYYFTERLPVQMHGTGDAFASAFAGTYCRGWSLLKAASLAADFVVESIKATLDDKDHWYGVKFEKAIPFLTSRL